MVNKTKRLKLKTVLGKSFEALLSGVSTGISTVIAASTVILPWSIWIRLSNKEKGLDGGRFSIGVFALLDAASTPQLPLNEIQNKTPKYSTNF